MNKYKFILPIIYFYIWVLLGRTPLALASISGHNEVARVLMAVDDLEVNS